VDPARIAAAGGSAGGHLAAMLGVTDVPTGLEGVGGHADQSSRVSAVIDFNGVSDLTGLTRSGGTTDIVTRFMGASYAEKPELYRKASPITHVSKSAPPFLFLHGTEDTTVPIEQSRAMARKLREAGVRAEIHETPGAGHGYFNRSPYYEPTLQRMAAFLEEQFR
jgi:dipeptidyl aminopeptidase/acylaminoacyl peptidase